MVFGDPVLVASRQEIFTLSNQYRLPVMYEGYQRVQDGGLIAYGALVTDRYFRAASYVDRIMKGERPAEMPVEGPNKFELAINLRAADALGLSIPESLLQRADRIVQ